MLPDTEDFESRGTMQAGDLERTIPVEVQPPDSMTVTRDISSSPHSQQPLLPPTSVATELFTTFKQECDFASTPASDQDGEKITERKSPKQETIIPIKCLDEKARPDIFGKFQDQNPNESVRSWLQRITQMQNEIQRKRLGMDTASSAFSSEFQTKSHFSSSQSSSTVQNTSRVVKYQDLPYMGEMTLDNSKPRRGRKPKKADICHLIYKNYGTIFPGTPKSLMEPDLSKRSKSTLSDPLSHETFQRSDVQNRIISSLLEKRLTQETKKSKDTFSRKTPKSAEVIPNDQDEPLNLCIRDLNQLKIRLLRKHGDVFSTGGTEVKSEPLSDDEVELVTDSPSSNASKTPDLDTLGNIFSDSTKPDTAPGGYVYWPNAGVFIHPMALQQHLMYYQRMAANNSYTLPSHSPRPPPESPNQDLRKLVPKTSSRQSTPKLDEDSQGESRSKRIAPQGAAAPPKRKRSAIFIPPIPTENQTNPATEVSICKFKFTGGAKPSLQEKKMLSVDSGGNFRYYSGTGDKSMRGYEFFPRETLQQAGCSQGSSTGAFLQASGEKLPMLPQLPEKQHNEFMLSDSHRMEPVSVADSHKHRKRKTRKSLQREKLEQTFKEKGFLIQTQQLESAEGATYCKFRQLRKFTRYLFRSWKDYLPGNVRDLQDGERSDEEREDEHDVLNAFTKNVTEPQT